MRYYLYFSDSNHGLDVDLMYFNIVLNCAGAKKITLDNEACSIDCAGAKNL